MPRGFHPRQQGDIGEAAAIDWLTRLGARVSFPLFHTPDYDLVADLSNRLIRVQVKTSSCRHGSTDHFAVQLAPSGGNQSWNGTVKQFRSPAVRLPLVLVQDGRRWFIPSGEVEGRHAVTVGGEKYSEFEVGRSEPLNYEAASTLDASWGGAGVGEPGRTVNPVAQPEWVRFPPPPSPPPSGGNPLLAPDESPAVGRTKLSSHYQVAVPRAVAAAASLSPGDRFRVESDGTGRFVMTRLEEYMEEQLARLVLPDEDGEPAGAERRAPD
jgi:bifunctional DNA-binding transcriptional regulator/antitoxin component of YhaV-PrlF toxin-antitoxin module